MERIKSVEEKVYLNMYFIGMNNLEKAIKIALKAHAGQIDKAGKIYILHPLRLMMQMRLIDEQIIAVLHDVVEDSDYTFDDLRKEGFDEEIISALQSLTKRNGEDYKDFIARIKENELAIIVKIADLRDNSNLDRISEPTKKDLERVEKYKKALEMLKESEPMRTLVHDAFKRPLYATDNFDVIRTVPQGKSFIGFMKIGKGSEVSVPTTGIVLNDVLLCGKEITKEEYFGSDGGVQQDIYEK